MVGSGWIAPVPPAVWHYAVPGKCAADQTQTEIQARLRSAGFFCRGRMTLPGHLVTPIFQARMPVV